MTDAPEPQAAIKSERDFERFFVLSADQMVIATLDGRYVRVNPAFTRQLGWTAAEVEGRSIFEHMHPDDHARTIAEVGALAAGEPTLHFENRYLTKAGAVRWLQWTAVPVPAEGRMYAVAHDVTAAREAAEALRTSRALLAGVLDSATSGVMAMDAVRDEGGRVVDFVFTLANPRAEQLTGMAAADLLGGRLLALFPGNVASGQMAMYLRVLATGEPGHLETYYNDGRLDFWLDVSAVKVGDGVAVTFTDVSDRRRTEKERDEAQQARIRALEEANVHKEQFLGILSHELRTPLNAIEGFGSILADGLAGDLNAPQAGYVEKILAASEHLLGLVDDLLDLSRIQAGHFRIAPADVDLAPILRGVLVEQAPAARAKGLALHDRLPPELPAVRGDARRLRQVLLNLVTNAVKYTDAGGSITVAAKPLADALRVEVADTGIGIPAAEHARVFESFTQVDMSSTRRRGGVGLGLSIVKALVTAHGGQVGLRSEPGRGSCFWFTVPRAHEEVRHGG